MPPLVDGIWLWSSYSRSWIIRGLPCIQFLGIQSLSPPGLSAGAMRHPGVPDPLNGAVRCEEMSREAKQISRSRVVPSWTIPHLDLDTGRGEPAAQGPKMVAFFPLSDYDYHYFWQKGGPDTKSLPGPGSRYGTAPKPTDQPLGKEVSAGIHTSALEMWCCSIHKSCGGRFVRAGMQAPVHKG